MGFILTGQQDYDAIRYALGLEKDQARLLTDQVLDGFTHLPAAELEARSRFTPPSTATDVLATLLARDINDPDLNALKCGVALFACANLCPRLETTIPVKADLSDLGSIERVKIDWVKKRLAYIEQANWVWSYISRSLVPQCFPRGMSHASGRIYPNDPIFYRDYYGVSSDLNGYIAPSVPYGTWGGSSYLYGFSFSM